MNSRVSWSVDGIDPSVRDRAEAAARRAGMSLNDWLNSTIGDSAPPDFRAPYEQQRQSMPSEASRDVADIHQRLDSITRQIDQISKPAPRNDAPRSEAPRGEPTVARQLNDAISRLDARLSQISNPAPRGRRRRRTSSARPRWSSAPPPRSIAPRRRSAPPRSIPRSRKSPRARTNSMARRRAVRRRGALTRPPPAYAPPSPRRQRQLRRPARISPRWNGICSRSRARSRRCSVPIISSSRSPPSAANSPRSATPSPRRCRAGRSNRSRTKSARCRAASTTTARAAPTARRWPASSARSAKSAKCCAR